MTNRHDSRIDPQGIIELQRKEQGNELTEETDHQIRSLICSLPARRMDSPYSARFRLVRPGRNPGDIGAGGLQMSERYRDGAR